MIFQTEIEKYELDEDFVHQIWDDIYTKKVFVSGENKEKDLFYSLLRSLGYLHHIKMQSHDVTDMKMGYQLDLGKGWAFLVRG